MYDAFELQKLVEKLPLKICSLATWGELVGGWVGGWWAINGISFYANFSQVTHS